MAQIPKKGLGRGFETLLPQTFDKALIVNDDEHIQKLAITAVIANPAQPRRHFDETALAELAASIRSFGVLLPLVVRPLKTGQYQIVAGERRWRASKLVGLKQVPAVVRTLKELEELEISLVENVQRVDLSALEQAASLFRLHEQFSISFETIAARLGKAPSTVNNIVRLLQLPTVAQAALAEHKISEGHARAILALKGNAAKQTDLLALIIKHHWSVREAERFVTSHKEGAKDTSTARARIQIETPVTKALAKQLGTSVFIKRTAKGGRLEINFASDAELQRIIDILN